MQEENVHNNNAGEGETIGDVNEETAEISRRNQLGTA